jgi:DNA polymerase-1
LALRLWSDVTDAIGTPKTSDRELQQRHMQSKMILQVHDELVFEAWQDELEILVPLVREVMENCFPLVVPLVVDIKDGKRWSELQPVKV